MTARMSRVWVDIEDSSGARLLDGPVRSFTRWSSVKKLSQSGMIACDIDAKSLRGRSAENKRILACRAIVNGALTTLGMGVIDLRRLNKRSRGVSGNDLLIELVDRHVGRLMISSTMWTTPISVWTLEGDDGVQDDYNKPLSYDGDPATHEDISLTHFDDPDTPRHDRLYVGHENVCAGFRVTFAPGEANNTVMTAQWQYFGAAGWTDLVLVDGTLKDGNKPMGQDGDITWTPPADEEMITHGGITQFWYRVLFSADIVFGLAELRAYARGPKTSELADIMAFAPAGWSLDLVNGYAGTVNGTYAQFGYESVLRALTMLAKKSNEHFILDPTSRKIRWLRGVPEYGMVHTVTAGTFVLGEDVVGGTSSARGVVQYVDAGANTIRVHLTSAETFITTETITGSTSGKIAVISTLTNRSDCGIRAFRPQGDSTRLMSNDDICFVNDIEQEYDTREGLITGVIPFGAGNSDEGVSLARCSRTVPTGFVLDTVNNRIYLSTETPDTRRDRVISFKSIASADNPEGDEAAANALFDAAIAWLRQHSRAYVSYKLSVSKVVGTILPGQTIHVTYIDYNRRGEWIEVDEDLIILETTEEIDAVGDRRVVGLTVSTIDRWPESDQEAVATIVENGIIYETHRQTSPYSPVAGRIPRKDGGGSGGGGGGGGSVGTDDFWVAKGDLAVGLGPSLATRLPSSAVIDGWVLTKDAASVTGIKWAVSPAGVNDHGLLAGLGDDDHSQYVHISIARTITAQHSFSPAAPAAPFLLGANAQGQLVTGLDADLLDGQHAAYYRDADQLDGQHGTYYLDLGNATGTLSTDRYSAYADLVAEGYLGDAAGDIALNDGNLQSTLNADMLDGKHDGDIVPAAHDITGVKHTITGAAFSVVGATALNTLGLLTPSSAPTVAALLKSDASGGLQLTDLTVLKASAPKISITGTDTDTLEAVGLYEGAALGGFFQYRNSINVSDPNTVRLGAYPAGSQLIFLTANSAWMRLTESGYLNIGAYGTSGATSTYRVMVFGADGASAGCSTISANALATFSYAPRYELRKTHGGSFASPVQTVQGEYLGALCAYGVTSGPGWAMSGRLEFLQSATSTAIVPSDLIVELADTTNGLVEKFRFCDTGELHQGSGGYGASALTGWTPIAFFSAYAPSAARNSVVVIEGLGDGAANGVGMLSIRAKRAAGAAYNVASVAGDSLGFIGFEGIQGDLTTFKLAGYILGKAVTVNADSIDGSLTFYTYISGLAKNRLFLSDTEMVINEDLRDTNLRIESSLSSYGWFFDAGTGRFGIGGLTAPGRTIHTQAAAEGSGIASDTYATGNNYSQCLFRHSNNNTMGTMTATVDAQGLAGFFGQGTNANASPAFAYGGYMVFVQNGAAGTTYVPTDCYFALAGDSNAWLGDVLHLYHTGDVVINETGVGDSRSVTFRVEMSMNQYGLMFSGTSGYLGLHCDPGSGFEMQSTAGGVAAQIVNASYNVTTSAGYAAQLVLRKSHHANLDTPGATAINESLGNVIFQGYDNTASPVLRDAAYIRVDQDRAAAIGSVSGRIGFFVAAASATPSEVLRIMSNKCVSLATGTVAPGAAVAGWVMLYVDSVTGNLCALMPSGTTRTIALA